MRTASIQRTTNETCISLELNLDGAQVLLAEDTHSGFHGDGETRIILVLDDASSAVESILSQWPAFPAPFRQ